MIWKNVIALVLALGLFAWAIYRGMKRIELDEHHRH